MWEIRRATRRDRRAIIALCHASVGSEDYVPRVLDDFLETGVVLVAADAGSPIGIVVYHDVPDGSAWLHAARTHPDYRRQGVATELMSRCESLARQRHRNAMRLWASAANVASVSANRKYGYRERARFTRMEVAVRSGETPRPERLDIGASTWASIRASAILELSAGYLFHDFYFLRLDRGQTARLVREGALWRVGGGGVSVSPGLSEDGGGLQVQPLFGDLRAFLRAAPTLAAVLGARRAETFLPHRADVLAAARAAGYRSMEWGREAILFEKPLRRSRRRA